MSTSESKKEDAGRDGIEPFVRDPKLETFASPARVTRSRFLIDNNRKMYRALAIVIVFGLINMWVLINI